MSRVAQTIAAVVLTASLAAVVVATHRDATTPATTDSSGVTYNCSVVQVPAGVSDYGRGGWALQVTVINDSGYVWGPSGLIEIAEYDASGSEIGYESDDSVNWPVIASGQSDSFDDINYDFSGSNSSSVPASCRVLG